MPLAGTLPWQPGSLCLGTRHHCLGTSYGEWDSSARQQNVTNALSSPSTLRFAAVGLASRVRPNVFWTQSRILLRGPGGGVKLRLGVL